VFGNLEISDVKLNSLKQPQISTIAKIQSHGIVLVLAEPSLTIVQVSSNARSLLGIPAERLLGSPLSTLVDEVQIDMWLGSAGAAEIETIDPTKIWVRKQGDDYGIFDAIFHRNLEGVLILELEPAISPDPIPFLSFYHLAQASIAQLSVSALLPEFGRTIVQEVQKMTGYDRVMLYKFDEDSHGEVIAEVKQPEMESYLGLHFPESDIPQPARKLFLTNSIRVIPNARAEAVDLVPAKHPDSDRATDLTRSILRSPYHCHLDYLEHMGVGASLTISLVKEGQLWGIIACHHRTPKYISYELRKACEFLGQVIFSEISSREEVADFNYQTKLVQVQSVLIDRMTQSDNFIDALVAGEPNLLELVDAKGAAICYGGEWTTIGITPSEQELNYLVDWLNKNSTEEIFITDRLPLIYADAQRFKDAASGLLAIPISRKSYVLWFRPEVLQTVNWGGDPHHAYELKQTDRDLYLCPRKSFELWKETVRLQSLPWKDVEVESAWELRKAIVNIVLRQAEELSILARDLARSNAELKKFAYVASHDLQEPLNQVANYVQLLEMRYDQQLDADAKDFISFAVEGVNLMQTLIDDVLIYSKVDLQGIEWQLTPVEDALNRAINNLRGKISETQAKITFDTLPTIVADSTQLMQLFQNILGNAIKFRQSDLPPQIHIGVERQEDEWLFAIADNGIGIDPQFFDRIFIIFQRLHTRDEYQGSGMGLTICKKIVECHRGRIWLESALGQGATFYFTIPVDGGHRDRVSGTKVNHNSPSRG
jgi:two-component system, chemotaxis family, sensor kinase Cph1